jgi:hypothetical protein
MYNVETKILNNVTSLLMNCLEANLTPENAALLVEQVAIVEYRDDLLEDVYSTALEFRRGLNKDSYEWAKQVLSALEDAK